MHMYSKKRQLKVKKATHNYQYTSMQVNNRFIQNNHVYDIDTNATVKQTKLSNWTNMRIPRQIHAITYTSVHTDTVTS